MSTENIKKLMIIDGNALIHRSFHAIPPTLTTQDGTIINAVYGFTSFLLKAFLEFKPSHVVLTLDRKAPTFRHKEYKEYKATRTAAPDELYAQFPLVRQVAQVLDMPIFELDGFEADDLIGTIIKKSEQETNFENYIVTGDMDTLQLVSSKTKVYVMSRGLNDSVTYDIKHVESRYGLKPEQIVDYKALRGDPSDNIPGVKGIGEKMSTELLQAFKTLDGVYQAAEKHNKNIKPRVQILLAESKDKAYLSQHLATINREAPIQVDWNALRLDSFDLETAIALFQQLEFRSLIPKLKNLKNIDNQETSSDQATAKTDYPDKFTRNAATKQYRLVKTEKEFADFMSRLKKEKFFALDTETDSLDPLTAALLGLSFSWQNNQAYYLDLSANQKPKKPDLFNYRQETTNRHPWLEILKPILEDKLILKCGHNLKFDYRVLKNNGLILRGISFDSMIASYLLNPDNRQHNLDAVSFRELGVEKISTIELIGQGQDKLSFSQISPEKMAQYSGEDADCAFRLAKVLKAKLRDMNLEKLLTDVDLPLLTVLGDMEDRGIKIDIKILKKIEITLGWRLKKLAEEIYQLAGETFNINSPKQLQIIFFEKLRLPVKNIKKTKTGLSTADNELEKLRNEHKIVPFIQEYRELNKLQSTYVLALPLLINKKTDRVHTSFNQTVAATGRLSSTDPNLQNIPTKTNTGQQIRHAFVACDGYKLLSFDYSQIELRLAAHISGDKKMIAAFKAAADIHTATAAEINGLPVEEVTKKMRQEAKATNFGILYGQGPHGLAQNAGIPYKQAQAFIEKYFESYPGIKKMMATSIEDAREKGYSETLFGRRRALPELNSSIATVRRAAERMAINTPIQGTAADLIKIAMINVTAEINGEAEEVRLLLQIHDELIFEIKDDKIEAWRPKIKKLMEDALILKVPVIVESSVGANWGELK